MLPWVAAIILTAIIAGLIVWNLKSPEPLQIVHFSYDLPEGRQFGDIIRPLLAVSPDGDQLIYSATDGLYLRSIDEINDRLIPGTGGDSECPFFSPDGQWVGYWSAVDKQLKKISITGGTPIPRANIRPNGPIWGADGNILYAQPYKGIMRVSANGGTPELLFETPEEITAFPRFLPDNKSLTYAALGGGRFRIVALLLDSGERKELFEGSEPQYLPTGYLLYSVNDTLYAVPFDPNRIEVLGDPVSVVKGVFRSGSLSHSQFAISESGTLVYVPGKMGKSPTAQRSLMWVDRNGKEQPLSASSDAYASPRISPDGNRVALTIQNGNSSDIWIWDFARENWTRLTFHEGRDSSPLWTRDGQRIVFYSSRDGGRGGIYWKSANGIGDAELLASAHDRALVPQSVVRTTT
jgi:Tol biopolymer transport system component